jgi:hypothetical protein
MTGLLARVRNAPKDIAAGLIFVAAGLGAFVHAHTYEIGTAVAMGPGYFPAAVGLVLTLLGVAAILRGLTQKVTDPVTPHRIAPLLLIFGGIVAFSLLIERAGLFVAAAALITLACFERLRTRPLEVLIVYLALTVFTAVVFVMLLGVQLPLFWWR